MVRGSLLLSLGVLVGCLVGLIWNGATNAQAPTPTPHKIGKYQMEFKMADTGLLTRSVVLCDTETGQVWTWVAYGRAAESDGLKALKSPLDQKSK